MTGPPVKKDFYRVEEVAELLDVHHATVRRWIKEKKIEAVKIAYWRISHEELVRVMNEGVE